MMIKLIKKHSVRNTILVAIASFILAGCGGGGAGEPRDEVNLPTDYALDLYCVNVGVYPENCVLDDPDNPYARSIVNDNTKWDLADAAPSAKARFYVWATALAKNPIGENQYYTALALHALYTQGGSTNAQTQAKLAYRSLLDNFFSSLTYYTAGKQLDLIPDTDFFYTDFGSGTAASGWNGGYDEDTDYTPVWYVPPGSGWGASTAALGFNTFTGGTAENYTHLVFKVKNLSTDNVWVKFTEDGLTNGGDEQSFDVSVYGQAIDGTTDWIQVTISLQANFANLSLYTGLIIHGGWGAGGTFLLTDVGFTGDATGNGLVGDDDSNGYVYLYRSGTQQYSIYLNGLVGRNIYSPTSIGALQLFGSQTDATAALTAWGYSYDDSTGVLSKSP